MADEEKVVVHASLRIKQGFGEEFLRAAYYVAEESKKEPGCIRYDILIDIRDPLAFHFIEEYANADAFESHRKQHYMDGLRSVRERVVEKYLGVTTLKEIAKR